MDPRIIGRATRERCDCERATCPMKHEAGACEATARYQVEAYGIRGNACEGCSNPETHVAIREYREMMAKKQERINRICDRNSRVGKE